MVDTEQGTPSHSDIVVRLLALARHDTRAAIKDEGHPPAISSFVTRSRETITQLVMPTAGLVIILEGTNEMTAGVDCRTFRRGDAFILRANARLDVVNEPDHKTGYYRALFVRFDRALIIEACRLWPQFKDKEVHSAKPEITGDLCSAILHAAEAFSYKLPVSRRVVEHRLLEVLLILAEQGVVSLAPKYVEESVVEAARLLIRHRLHLAWTTASVAAEFSMSEATLRRRFRVEGHSLQALLLDERMKAAYMILSDRDADVADALAATGYRSRSHFSRQVQKRFGATPSEVRAKGCAVLDG